MAQQPGLTAEGGPKDKQFFPLQETDTLIGRNEPCAVQITWDPGISRQHARIYQQSGLYWLEDLGSTNHTYFTTSNGEERQLDPHESVLLLDGGFIRLGKHVTFRVDGLSTSQDEALQMLTARLKQVLANLYTGLNYLSPEERLRQLEWLRDFENRLRSAPNQEEILRIASEGTQTLFGTIRIEPPGDELPPLPENLPDPAMADQVKSILNFFITDVHDLFPKEDDKDA